MITKVMGPKTYMREKGDSILVKIFVKNQTFWTKTIFCQKSNLLVQKEIFWSTTNFLDKKRIFVKNQVFW